jgi:hypothetical protein
MDLGQGSAMALPIVGEFWKSIRNDKYLKKYTDTRFPENKTAINLVGCAFKTWMHPDSMNISSDSLGYYLDGEYIEGDPMNQPEYIEEYKDEIEDMKAAKKEADEEEIIEEEKKKIEEKKKEEEKKKAEEDKKKTEEKKKAEEEKKKAEEKKKEEEKKKAEEKKKKDEAKKTPVKSTPSGDSKPAVKPSPKGNSEKSGN